MPPRKKYKKKRKTRRKTRRKTYVAEGVPSGMPTVRRALLRYCTSRHLNNAGLGALDTEIIRVNSLFDPEHKAGGVQPMGFDQWALLFNRYVVVGAKITIKWSHSGSQAGTPCMVGCYLTDSATVPYSTYQGFVEARRGVNRLLTDQRNEVSMSTTYSAKKFFNITDIKDNVDRLGALTSANPTQEAFFTIWAQSLDQASDNDPYALIVVEYLVDFSEPRDLNRS